VFVTSQAVAERIYCSVCGRAWPWTQAEHWILLFWKKISTTRRIL